MARFTYNDRFFSVSFKSSYDGKAYFEINPREGEPTGFNVTFFADGRRLSGRQKKVEHHAFSGCTPELARAAYAVIRRAEHDRVKDHAHRQNMTAGQFLRLANR